MTNVGPIVKPFVRRDVRVAKNSIGSEGRTARLAARFQEARARLDGTVAGQILQRLREIDARARAVGLAGQAFIAFVPLAMLLAPWSLGENEPSFSVRVIDYLDLTGSTAEAVDVVFGTEPTVGGLSIAGVFVIQLSLRALAQAYQRSWEVAWQLPSPARGKAVVGIAATLLMLVVLVGIGMLGKNIGLGGLIIQIPLALVGWWTVAYLALSRRVSRHRLVPAAIVMTTVHLAMTWWTQLYVPRLMAAQVARYGVVGIAFGFVFWMLIASYVLVVGAVVGAIIDNNRARAVGG